eukprot:2929094-Prymnesium_polylepis.2
MPASFLARAPHTSTRARRDHTHSALRSQPPRRPGSTGARRDTRCLRWPWSWARRTSLLVTAAGRSMLSTTAVGRAIEGRAAA